MGTYLPPSRHSQRAFPVQLAEHDQGAAPRQCAYGLAISLFIDRKITWHNFYNQALRGAVSNNSMIFLLVAAALLFSSPLAFARLPQEVATWAIGAGLSPMELILMVTLLWLIMGMFLDALPIMYLTVPVVLPALIAADVNLIYMNVILVLSMQIGQVSPPFGISLYVTSGIMGVPITSVVHASLPFLAVLILCLAVLIVFPSISLFLPELMSR